MIYLLSQLIDRVADRAPDQDAFRGPGSTLTYAQLAEQSNQLARLLIDEGVRRGDRVGIFMPRCLESALAVYGTLKAGAAYVPIDPHMPLGGLRGLIEICGIRHVIAHDSQARIIAKLRTGEGGGGFDGLVLGPRSAAAATPGGENVAGARGRSRPWSDLDAYSRSAPAVQMMEDDLAYIMFSSGSTGRPKGIVHSHRSGLSYARLSVETYDVGPEDRIGNHSPLHFDMSTFGYFSGPLAGATTLLIPEAYTKVTASLSQLMEQERLTIWYSVPLALIQLLMRGVLESRDLGSLRWVLFGGEPFARQHLHALMKLWPQARFSNVYGPAEVNQCTYFHVPHPPAEMDAAEDDARRAPVPIGQTWANTEGLVLDEHDQPVANGEIGELVIRSPTMMKGYWARADLDAKAFYQRADESGFDHVFYRTGDLVRTVDGGDMLFLGRKDRQVKVRGYRIELDDLERTLAAQPVVEEAAVFPVRRGGEVVGLEAAVTLKAGAQADAESLRDGLAEVVSWYAVPSRLDLVEQFPRTTSGKIDRRRLQTLAEERTEDREPTMRQGG